MSAQGTKSQIQVLQQQLDSIFNGDIREGSVWSRARVLELRRLLIVNGAHPDRMKIDTNLFYHALEASHMNVSKDQIRGRLKNLEYAWYEKWFAVRLQQQMLQRQLDASQVLPPISNSNNNNSNNATPFPVPGQLALADPLPRSADQGTPKTKDMEVETESDEDDYEDSDDESDVYKPPRKKSATHATRDSAPQFLAPCCAHEFPEIIVTEEYCYVVMTKSPRRLISMGVCRVFLFVFLAHA
jgi:hypothetical protein